jgi:hypothetical protein
VPQPPVEDEGVAGGGEDRFGAGRRVEAQLRMIGPRQGVALVASRDDQDVAAAGHRDVGEPEGDLERQPGAGIAVELEVLAPSVLMPAPGRGTAWLGARRGDVEVAVVEVDVPAQLAPDQREHRRVVEQIEEEVVAPELAEQMHRLARAGAARRDLLFVDAVEGGRQARHGKRPEGAGYGDEAVRAQTGGGLGVSVSGWSGNGSHEYLELRGPSGGESLHRCQGVRSA